MTNTWRIPSKTHPGTAYTVTRGIDGTFFCTCPSGMQQGRVAAGIECWHVKYVREETMNDDTSTALVPVKVTPSVALLPTKHDMAVIEQAARMVMSGHVALPQELKNERQVAAVMLYGLELGLKPMTAIRHLYIVNGKVSPSAEVMAGMLMASEPDAQLIVEELTDQTCTMRIKRPSKGIDQPYTVTWQEIEKAGLAKGDMNSKYPRDRLRYHTTKRLLRIYAPEVINNIDGVVLGGAGPDVVEGEVTASDLYNEGDEQPAAPSQDEITIAYIDLVQKHGQKAGQNLMAWAEHEFPNAKPASGKFDKSLLADGQRDALLQELRRYARTGVQRCPGEEHTASTDDATSLLTCGVCGLVLEEPEPDTNEEREPVAQALPI